ncbi:MAG: hypothetical protein RR454_00280, partial [Clostridia bacterium]
MKNIFNKNKAKKKNINKSPVKQGFIKSELPQVQLEGKSYDIVKPKTYHSHRATFLYFFLPFVVLAIFESIAIIDSFYIHLKFTKNIEIILNIILHGFIGIPFLISLLYNLNAIFIIFKVNLDIETIKNGRCVMIEGAPGTGKTLITTYKSYYNALDQQESLRLQAIDLLNKDYFEGLNAVDNEKKNIVVQSLQHYRANPGIQNLHSTVAIFDKQSKLFSYVATPEEIKGGSRRPEKATYDLSESGDIVTTNNSNQKGEAKESMNRNLSEHRQSTDTIYVCDEQDKDDNGIMIRRIVDFTMSLEDMKQLLRPKFLLSKLSKINDKILLRSYSSDLSDLTVFAETPKEYKRKKLLNKLISKIGYFKINYHKSRNIKGQVLEKHSSFLIPFNRPFDYDTRAYWLDYEDLYYTYDFFITECDKKINALNILTNKLSRQMFDNRNKIEYKNEYDILIEIEIDSETENQKKFRVQKLLDKKYSADIVSKIE